MPASIHPPVQLTVVLDEESYEGGDSVEMARRFAAVAPAEIVRASKGSQRANVLRFDLGTDAVTDEAADDALWRQVLTTWLDEEFSEVSALVARENDARENKGKHPVAFTWAEVKFGTGPVIAIRMKDSAIPPEAAGFVTRARMLLADGAFGVDPIAAIRIPACASIEAQQDGGAGEAADPRNGAHRSPDHVSRDLEAIGKEERGSSSASDIIAAVDAVIDDEGAGAPSRKGGWSAADPDSQNAWAGSAMEQEGPSRSELDDALAEAEAALRHGSDPVDAEAEERVVAAEEDQPPASVRTDEASDADAERAPEDAAGKRASAEQGSGATVPAEARDDTAGEGCALLAGDVPEDLSYRVWNVAYADGTSVRYDSVLGEALLD